MSHSVRRHLGIEIDAYDATIRRFLPGYDEMIRVAAKMVAADRPRRVLDLGAGTGALAASILEHGDVKIVDLIEVDPQMLEQARLRLAAFGTRARERLQSFHDPLPTCDAAAASLALHHVPTLREKRGLYRRVHDALRAGGVFVNADVVMPAAASERDAVFGLWADHMAGGGITRALARAHFAEWADEDTYFPLEDEMAALRAAGFCAKCIWHEGPVAVLAGRKKARPARAS